MPENQFPEDGYQTSPATGRLNHPDDIKKYFSSKTFKDFLEDKENIMVYCTLLMDGKDFLWTSSYEVAINQKTNEHDEFTITVPDDALDSFEGYLMENSKNILGNGVTIKFHQYGEITQTFEGFITKIKNKKENGYGFLEIIGNSPTIFLESGLRSRSFENQTLEQIIAEVCRGGRGEGKISVQKPQHTATIPYTVQYLESNYAFVQRLAKLYGEYFYYNGSTIIFGNAVQPIITLEDTIELMELETEITTKPQHFGFTAYDSESGGTAEAGSHRAGTQYKENPFLHTGMNASKKMYTDKAESHYNPAGLQNADGELGDAARRERENRENLVTVHGKSSSPKLRVGGRARLVDINGHAMETYRILEVRHYHDGNQYYNEFVGIPDLFNAPYQDNFALPLGEAQPARVLDNNDPMGMGRLRVQFPWQVKSGEKTPWIRLVQPHSGSGKGFHFIPEIGEEVMVGFEGGNLQKPFVMGAHYNGAETSGYHTSGNDKKVIHTRSGTKIVLNDAEGSVFIEDPSGNSYTMDGRGNIKIRAPKNMSFEAGKNMYFTVGENMITNVGLNKTVFAGMNYAQTIGLNYISSVSGNSTSKIKGESLTQSQSQLKIEAKQMDVAGFDNLFLHSDKTAKINSKGLIHVQGLDGTEQNNTPDNYVASIEEKEAICIANVRPLPTWKGEFGCDYYQSGNSALGDEFDFAKILGKYYKANDDVMTAKLKTDSSSSFAKYFIGNCNQWYTFTANPDTEKYDVVHNFRPDPQYKEQDNTLEILQNQYAAFKYRKNKDDKETLNCYAGYISLFPSDWKTDAPKKAFLKLYFDFLTAEKPDEIIFKIGETLIDSKSPVQISPSSIPTPAETADITISTVERYKYASFNEDFISIKIIAKKKQGETFVETSAGEIRLMNPKKAKTLKILQMQVKTVISNYIPLDPEVRAYTKKILNQCLIDPEFIEYTNQKNEQGKLLKFEIDVSSKNPKRLLNARKISDGNWQISDENGKLGPDLLLPAFLEKYPEYKSNEFFRLYVMDVDSVDGGAKESGYSSLGMNYCILFKSSDKTTLPHEVLHGLGLPHTFCNTSQFTFKALVTHNIMDYSDMKNDPIEAVTDFNNKKPKAPSKFVPLDQYQLWFWQWKKANETNTKV